MRFLNRRHRHLTLLRTHARKNNRVTESIVGATKTKGLRRKIRRNRVLLVTLLVVGGLVAVLTGLAMGHGEWYNQETQLGSNTRPPLPPPRFGAATTYDATAQQVVLFGGFVGTTSVSSAGSIAGPPIVTDGTTYLYTQSLGWGRRDPIHRPSPRGFAAMAYDGARKNIVLFGGAPYRAPNAAVSGETWIWDGYEGDWTLAEPPEPRPDPRQNAVMVYDAHRKVVVMFGGRGADGKPMNDTWVWDGSAWTIMPSAGAPSPRHSAAMAYDVCNAEAVMFGGIGDPINNFVRQPGETWTWNGAKWTPESPPISPTPARVGASMAYSYRSGRVLLYGGLAATDAGVPTAAVDTAPWRWDGATNTWEKMVITDLSPMNNIVLTIALGDGRVRGAPPPPRAYASFTNLAAYDVSGEVLGGGYFNLFGGTPFTDLGSLPFAGPTPQAALGDHFVFSEPGVSGNGSFDTDQPRGVFVDIPPLVRRCVAPVPLPPEEAGQIDLRAEADKARVSREGVREIGQFPLLLGADWPQSNRDTHLYGTPPRPNPNYTPAPDCPNRTSGENGVYGERPYLVTDPKHNRVYQFFLCDSDRGSGYNVDDPNNPYWRSLSPVHNLLIEVYNATTLKPLARVIMRTEEVSGPTGLVDDAARGRFLLPVGYSGTGFVVLRKDLIEKGVDPLAGKIDYSAMPGTRFTTHFAIHPKSGRAKMFFTVPAGGATAGPPPAQNTPPKLGLWDLEDARLDWIVELTGGCGPMFPDHRPGIYAGYLGDHVYATCVVANSQFAVVKIPIRENSDGSESPGGLELFPGPYFVSNVWGDPKTERVVLHGAGTNNTIWVFDGKASRWVGRTGVGVGFMSGGFDPEAGRLYVHKPDSKGDSAFGTDQGGVKVMDTRLTPVSQALTFPQFASPLGVQKVATLPSAPGVPRRIFIRVNGGTMKKYPNWETIKFTNEMFYRVLADEIPVPDIADLSELDALTIPVAEKPGKTEVSFDAEGSGYGIRLRSLGGVHTAVRPFAQAYASLDQWESLALPLVRYAVPTCVFPDRELMAGWVPQARLSDIDALARSSGLEVDSNSKTDLQGPFSRCNPTAEASNFPPSIKVVFDVLWPLWGMVQFEGNKVASEGTTIETGKDADGQCGQLKQQTPAGEVVVSDCTETPAGTISRGQDSQGQPTVRFDSTTSKWDSYFKEVECVGDALATNQAAVGNIYGSAKCVQRQGLVEATARGSATGSGPLAEEASKRGFSVAEGYSTVTVTRDSEKGVVVTSTAIAKGIQLPGASFGVGNLASLSIDRVETKAVAWSNGRPSDPLENPRATFTRIICGVHTLDGSIPGCLTAAQQQTMVDNWNRGWGKNSKMLLPTPDPAFYEGSPGGYIAGVIKPVANETEDTLFAKDSLKEVSGLEIIFYKDSQYQGNARQTLQLAAVRAVAGLGVQCNPDLLYSSSTNDCVALPDDLLDDEFFEEDEEEFLEDEELELDGEGGWTEVEVVATGESLGSRIGRFIQNLPVIRRLPIRQMGEALLAGSVWVLLGLPLLFAWRRLSLNVP